MEGKLRSSVPSPERSYWTGSVAAFDPDIAGRGARRRTAIAEPLPPEWQPAEAFEDLSATDRAMLDALLVEFSTSSPEVFRPWCPGGQHRRLARLQSRAA